MPRQRTAAAPFPIAATLVMAAALAAGANTKELIPKAHPLERYAALWDSGWFPLTKDLSAEARTPASEEPPFPYKLVGLAEGNDKQWVYLSDAKGKIVELSSGNPSGNLSLVRVEADESDGDRVTVHVRQGTRLVQLQFANPDQTAGRVSRVRIDSNSSPARPYPNWERGQAAPPTVTAGPGHRVPGATPVPPPTPAAPRPQP